MFLENIIHINFFLIAESGQEIHSQENTMFLDVRVITSYNLTFPLYSICVQF